jgi:peptidoglycan/LPS O-acetylase OafA/YrhL
MTDQRFSLDAAGQSVGDHAARGRMRPVLAQPPGASSIAARFDRRSNGITPLRLVLALIVLAMHVWPLGGFGPDPVQRLTAGRVDGGGTLAVLCFFGLSGFLLADSRSRAGTFAFLGRRAARILPAYWVCIVASTIVLGAWYAPKAWLPSFGVGGLTWAGFAANPLPQVNAPLWTLAFEIACYLGVAVVAPRHLGRLIVAAGSLMIWLMIAGAPGSGSALVLAFFTGVALYRYGARIPLDGRLVAIGLLGAFATAGPGIGLVVTAVVLPYAAIWVSTKPWPHLRADFSYGVYIYAFPITQLLVIAGFAAAGPMPLIVATMFVTLPFAAASWFLVERPVLRFQLASPIGATMMSRHRTLSVSDPSATPAG